MAPSEMQWIVIIFGVIVPFVIVLIDNLKRTKNNEIFPNERNIIISHLKAAIEKLELGEGVIGIHNFEDEIDKLNNKVSEFNSLLAQHASRQIWDTKTVALNEYNRDKFPIGVLREGLLTESADLIVALNSGDFIQFYEHLGHLYLLSKIGYPVGKGGSIHRVGDKDKEVSKLLYECAEGLFSFGLFELSKSVSTFINSQSKEDWLLFSPLSIVALFWTRTQLIYVNKESWYTGYVFRNKIVKKFLATDDEMLGVSLYKLSLGIAEGDQWAIVEEIQKYYSRPIKQFDFIKIERFFLKNMIKKRLKGTLYHHQNSYVQFQ